MLTLRIIGTSSILHSLNRIIENSRDVGVKLPKGVLQLVEELEEGIIKEEILPVLSRDIAPNSLFLYFYEKKISKNEVCMHFFS